MWTLWMGERGMTASRTAIQSVQVWGVTKPGERSKDVSHFVLRMGMMSWRPLKCSCSRYL
jgi:hypothetical protein